MAPLGLMSMCGAKLRPDVLVMNQHYIFEDHQIYYREDIVRHSRLVISIYASAVRVS